MTSVVNTKITKFMSFFSFSGEGEIIRLTHYICKQKKKKDGIILNCERNVIREMKECESITGKRVRRKKRRRMKKSAGNLINKVKRS